MSSLLPIIWLKKKVHYLPQGGQIFSDLTIEDNFNLAGRFQKIAQIKDRTKTFFSFLEDIPDGNRIIDNFNKRAGNLSGGQRQIVSLGMALLGEPELLFLDEPTAGLAVKISEIILKWLNEQNIKKGLTIFVVEHNLRNILQLSNRVINMSYGKTYEMNKTDFSDIEVLRKKVFEAHEGLGSS